MGTQQHRDEKAGKYRAVRKSPGTAAPPQDETVDGCRGQNSADQSWRDDRETLSTGRNRDEKDLDDQKQAFWSAKKPPHCHSCIPLSLRFRSDPARVK